MRATFNRLAGRRSGLVARIIIGLLAAILPTGVALAQQAPPGASSRYLSRFQVTTVSGTVDLVQSGADFAAGVATPDFAYSGPAYNTVMAGQITVRAGGASKVYKPGETWTDQAGQAHSLVNEGQNHAIVYTSVLLPGGANLTMTPGAAAQSAPAGPASLFLTRFASLNPPSPLDLVQVELSQQPGGWTAVHSHPGATYTTVIAGTLMQRSNGQDTTYGPGQSWVLPGGQVHAVENVGSTTSVALSTFLIPRSATQVTHPVADAPSTLPVTGAASPRPDYRWPVALALVMLAGGAAVSWLRRRGPAA